MLTNRKPVFDSSTPIWHGRIRQQLYRYAEPVLDKKTDGLFSITLDAPISLDLPFPASDESRYFWHRPSENHKLMGLGVALVEQASGSGRFEDLKHAYTRLQQNWTHIVHGSRAPKARAFLGYAFSPDEKSDNLWTDFSNSLLSVPELLIEWRQEICTLTFTCESHQSIASRQIISRWLGSLEQLLRRPVEEGTSEREVEKAESVPEAKAWLSGVDQVKKSIAKGRMEKVVLGRRMTVSTPHPIAINLLLGDLSSSYEGCTILAASHGDITLLAATPEKLVSLKSGHVTSDALAGTLPADDEQVHLSMQEYEHKPVVTAIREALFPLCDELEAADRPDTMVLCSIKHMWTPVTGKLKPGVDLFDLIAALHPTPAVGGMPRIEAMSWIQKHEGICRGWYTGGFGWLGEAGGEISVLLRCALLNKSTATLFAGAGITAISDPEKELMETEMKFEVILQGLKN